MDKLPEITKDIVRLMGTLGRMELLCPRPEKLARELRRELGNLYDFRPDYNKVIISRKK